MKVYRPTYTAQFKCNGKACGSRCCRDWQVAVDKPTREKFLSLPEVARADFFRHVTTFNAAQVIRLTDSGACPFLDENLLCRLQLTHGEDFLPAICQSFPRVTYRLADEIFLQAMTLTCPVAAIEILLQPITFEVVEAVEARQIFDFTQKLSMPAEKFLSVQMAAIEILQRDMPINQRLKNLCEHFGEISAPVDFDAVSNAAALVEIFDAMYDAALTFDKKNRLVEMYLTHRDKILPRLHETFALVLENYLVNEFFMRLYPCAFTGDERFNVRVFVTAWRAVEFAAVLTTISHARLTLEDFLEMLCALSDKLDHSRGGMSAIKTFAELHDAEIFYAMMIDGGGYHEGNS